MLRPRRDGRSHRFVNWQLALFFVAAGIWLTGVLTERRGFTEVSIVVLLLAIALGMVGRRP